MKTYFIILCAALLIGTAISVKPAHPGHPGNPGHPGHPGHPAHPAEPANPAQPQNPRFSLFEPIVFYPFAAIRAFVVTVVTIIRVILQCVFAYLSGAKPTLATAYENFNNTAILCMGTINETTPFDPEPVNPPPPQSPNPTLNEMCDDDDSGRVFDSTSKDIAFDGAEQTYYYISGEMNMFAGFRADDPNYAFSSPQFRPPPPPTAPAAMSYAKSGTTTTCATVTPVSVYFQATYFIEYGKVLKQTVIDIHNEIQEIKNTTGIDCECTDIITPTIKQITDDIDAINTAMAYNQYYYYSYAAMVTVSSAALITKMENSIKKCEALVTKVRDSHVKINSEIKNKKDKSYKKLKEDKRSGKINDDQYCEGVRKQNNNSKKHGRKHAHNGFRKNRRNREDKEKNVRKARRTMVENWKKTVTYFDTTTYYVNDWLQIVKPKLNSLSAKFKTMSDDMERIFSNRQKRRNQVHTEANDSYIIHSEKHHREHERCTEVIIKDNSQCTSCQEVLDKVQDYTLSFDVEARKCHDKGFKLIDDLPDNAEAATMKIAEMLQNITKGVDKCIANTNAYSIPLINWLPIWVRNICADCLEKMLQEAITFKSKAEALCKEELDNSTMTTAINTCKTCHENKSKKLTQFTIAFEIEILRCRSSEPTLSTPASSTTQSSTTRSSTTVSSTTRSSTTGSSTTGSSTTRSSTTGSSTTGSSTTGSSTTGSSTTGSSTTRSSTTGSSTTGSSTTGSSTTGSSTTQSSTTGSSTTGSSTTPSSTTGSSTTGSSTTGSSTTGSSTTGSSTTPSSTTGSSTTGSSTTVSSTTGSSTTGSSTTGSSTTPSSTTGSSTTGSSTTGSSTTGSSTTESSTTGSSTTGSSTTGSSTTGSSTTGSSTTPSSTTGSSTTESSTTGSSTTGSSTTGSSTTPSSTTGSSTTGSTTTVIP